MEGLASLLPFLLIAAAFWFLLIRPQRRQQHRMLELQRSLAVGDEVMLGSGLYGTVALLHDDRIDLEIAPGVRVQVARAAIVRVDRDENVAAPVDSLQDGDEQRDGELPGSDGSGGNRL